MAYAIVGSQGATSQGASGAAVTPGWGLGSNRTANNLLICQVAMDGSAAGATTPSGWTFVVNSPGTSCGVSLFFKIAAGGDAAPTIAAITGGVIAAKLTEWSGGATGTAVDTVGVIAGTTTPQLCVNSASDLAAGELVIGVAALLYSAAATKTFTETWNNGMVGTVDDNAAVSTVNHYHFWFATTTAFLVPAQDSLAFTTTKITGAALAIASFLLAPAAGTIRPVPIIVKQAVNRAAVS